MKYELPNDFFPDIAKSFSNDGNPFTVWVQYKGIITEGPDITAPVHRWLFAIVVGEIIVETGPYHWDPSDRTLTNENVANHLASFYQVSDSIKKAQSYTVTRVVAESRKWDASLDTIIFKCAAYMFQMLITEHGSLDYDIIEAVVDETGWRVILFCSLMPSRLFEFRHMNDGKHVTINTYIKAHTFHTEI